MIQSLLRHDATMPTYRHWPIEIVTGNGSTVFDADGRSYLDLTAGIAVASVGHCHPAVVNAIAEQAQRLIHISNLYATQPQTRLARRLSDLTGGKLAFFGNSGAEAIECALKLARKWGRERKNASKIVAAENAFHGRTLGALAATGQRAKQAPFAPLPPGFVHVPYGDPDALAAAMDEEVCAVLLEPIQGEAGVIVPPDDYLALARSLCDRWDALLILDEIQTGLGRTGRWFAYDHSGVVPDIVCLAKALASGLPLGACLATPEVAEVFAPGDHGSTFGGGPVQSAAALATLEVIESEGLVERAERAGARLIGKLRDLFVDAEVRGGGLLIGIEFRAPIARDVAAAALANGVLINDIGAHVIRLCPPLVITDDEIDHALDVLEEVMDEIATA